MSTRVPTDTLPVEDLTESQATTELRRLAREITGHDKRYHQDDAPTISDAQYDALRARNNAIEARFPALVRKDSPSRKVGAAPAQKFKKVRHAVPMLSLGNAFAAEEVGEFVERVRRFLKLSAEEEVVFTAEPKIDGLSMSLRYERGKLVNAATRGDGAVGEDVTANIKTLKDVPQALKGKDIPDIAEIRGEVYMTKADFLALNERQKAAGKELYVNPRNTAAGSVRQKDASITAARPLRFFAYAWGQMSEMPADTQSGMVKWLGKAGFHTNPIFNVCKSAEELLKVHEAEGPRGDRP
jgi:DNA ligase (NAD+)